MANTFFELRGVAKRFGSVQALRGVDLAVDRGEVHALVGENGAGKSTLMKILSGAYQPDGGTITRAGRPYRVTSPTQARTRGVAMIYQELTLASHLTVGENLILGTEDTRFGFIREHPGRLREALSTLGHRELDLRIRVRDLSIGNQQVVEIARALLSDAELIIMDEPTSSLSSSDADMLFDVIRKLRDSGVAIIYISHFLEEVTRIADRYTVLRDGESVATGLIEHVTTADLVEQMVGRSLDAMFPMTPHDIGERLVSVTGLSGEDAPTAASFELRRGEILGIAGLVGSGRSETVRALFGLIPAREGTVTFSRHGKVRASWMRPSRALARGLDLLSEDRKNEGLAGGMTIRENVVLSSQGQLSRFGFADRVAERAATQLWCDRLKVRRHSDEQAAGGLSGGNQQKVALARILFHDSDMFFLDEPTRGIDVGSKAEICALVGELAARGKAVVIISSYLPELFGMCDTLAVMHRGKLSVPRPLREWTERSVMLYAASGTLDLPRRAQSGGRRPEEGAQETPEDRC